MAILLAGGRHELFRYAGRGIISRSVPSNRKTVSYDDYRVIFICIEEKRNAHSILQLGRLRKRYSILQYCQQRILMAIGFRR